MVSKIDNIRYHHICDIRNIMKIPIAVAVLTQILWGPQNVNGIHNMYYYMPIFEHLLQIF